MAWRANWRERERESERESGKRKEKNRPREKEVSPELRNAFKRDTCTHAGTRTHRCREGLGKNLVLAKFAVEKLLLRLLWGRLAELLFDVVAALLALLEGVAGAARQRVPRARLGQKP